jgi:hypothetical protein
MHMTQSPQITPYVEAAFKAARSNFPTQHRDWVNLSAGLAGRAGIAPLFVSIQRLGDLDLLLRAMEAEAAQNGAPQGPSMAFHYQMMLSETWVMASYEALRAIRQREAEAAEIRHNDVSSSASDDVSQLQIFKDLFRDLELLRMPIAKYELAKDQKMKAPLPMQAYPPNGDATDVQLYDKADPVGSHIMPSGLSDRKSVAWHVLDHSTSASYWVERRDLADRFLSLKGAVEPAGLREARLAAEKLREEVTTSQDTAGQD